MLDRRAETLAMMLPLGLALTAPAFGAMKIAIGLERDRPVALLIFACVATAIAAIALFARRSPRTHRGEALLASRKAEYQTTPAATQTPDSLVTAMLGRAASLTFPERVRCDPASPTVLSVRGLSRRGAFDDVSFTVRAGEIVGLTGLVGSGRSEVARSIFGADRLDSGTIELNGTLVDIRSPRDGIARGIAMLPESRKDQGLHMRLPVGHNVTLPHLSAVSHAGGIIDASKERVSVGGLLQRLAVKPPKVTTIVSRLSGGNQQKVLFSKWLFEPPRVLLLDEPTRGVDVGAKRALYELIVSLAASGMGVLLISSEIEEILGLAHRVLVMRRGLIVAEFAEDELNEEQILRAAFGSEQAAALQVQGKGAA